MQPINIIWNPDIEAYETSWPYNQKFIDWIKKNIPTNKRSMDFDALRNPKYKWIFEKEILETVILPLMKKMFFVGYKFTIIDKAKVDEYNQGFQQGTAIDRDALSKEFRQLVTEAGIDTTLPDRKQYLRAAMYYHPDRRPELAAKMSRLNEIWTTVFEPRIAEQQEVVSA